jgi:hypothetical protein
MYTHDLSTRRREDRCKVIALILGASDQQIDDHRMRGESREAFKDRVLRIAESHPYEALVWLGGA